MDNNLIPCNLTARQIAKSLLPHMVELDKKMIDSFTTNIEISEDDGDTWEKNVMEEFLLFPPDLFAFTSAILSITGAYHLVVSPPRYKTGLTWRPYEREWMKEIFGYDNKGQWIEEVRKVGLKWRLLLNKNFNEAKLEECKTKDSTKGFERLDRIKEKVGILIEKVETRGSQLEWIAPGQSERWVPDEVRYYWEEFRRGMSPIPFCHDERDFGSIEELLCDEEKFREAEKAYEKRKRLRQGEVKPPERRRNTLPEVWKCFCALLTLHAIADEACVGWGLRAMDDELEEDNSKETYRKYLEPKEEENNIETLQKYLFDKREWNYYKDIKETVYNRRLGRAVIYYYANDNKEIPAGIDKISSSNLTIDTLLKSLDYEYKEDPQKYAESLLKKYGTMSTVNNLRCRVLPKRHTPSVGITLRALSSNLAYHRSSIDVRWRTEYKVRNGLIQKMEKIPPNERTFSLLLLPWGLNISSLDFTTVKADPRLGMRDDYGFFAYSPRNKTAQEAISIQTLLIDTLDAAKKETTDIDMIILPECALDVDEVADFENIISKYNISTYVAGIRDSNKKDEKRHFHDNMVIFRVGRQIKKGDTEITDFGAIKAEEVQHKHHRWRLNRSQIETYNLGHILSPSKDWWEAIKIRRRKVTFVNIGDELTVCPLICEDLARQDPIADLIRTVGPSLVITILMDGPQKKERWSAKYASVLAEDPGCAIITLTSLGMVKRSLPPNVPPSRVVALWNDGISFAREIELKEGAAGILLSLSVEAKTEVMADGRKEIKSTNCIKLGGIHQIYPKTNILS